jgi:hypothetical protein
MKPNRQGETPQNSERFQWENEEEATWTEVESMGYSALSVGAGVLVIIVSCTLLIIL